MKQKIKHNFNNSVLHYDDFSQLQQTVGHQLITLTAPYSKNTVIDLGCGTGAITEQFTDQYALSNLHAIDFSEKSIEKSQQRLKHLNTHCYVADFDLLPFQSQQFDLAFSNMALHWSPNLNKTLKEIARILSPNGALLFSLPIMGTLVELHEQSRYPFLSSVTIRDQIEDAGFNCLLFQSETIILNFPDIITALHSIKKMGAHSLEKRHHRSLRAKSALRFITSNSRIAIHQPFSLTYLIGYFVAEKNMRVSICP